MPPACFLNAPTAAVEDPVKHCTRQSLPLPCEQKSCTLVGTGGFQRGTNIVSPFGVFFCFVFLHEQENEGPPGEGTTRAKRNGAFSLSPECEHPASALTIKSPPPSFDKFPPRAACRIAQDPKNILHTRQRRAKKPRAGRRQKNAENSEFPGRFPQRRKT